MFGYLFVISTGQLGHSQHVRASGERNTQQEERGFMSSLSARSTCCSDVLTHLAERNHPLTLPSLAAVDSTKITAMNPLALFGFLAVAVFTSLPQVGTHTYVTKPPRKKTLTRAYSQTT